MKKVKEENRPPHVLFCPNAFEYNDLHQMWSIGEIVKQQAEIYVIHFIEPEVSLEIQRDLLVEYGLCKGMQISLGQITEIFHRVAYYKVYQKALVLLNNRDHFVLQIKQKLLQRGYDHEDVDEVIHKLIEQGLLNDANTAIQWVETNKNKKSKTAMRYYLKEMKLSHDKIEQALESCNFDELEGLTEAMRKKLKGMSHAGFPLSAPIKTKLITAMARLGYDYRSCQLAIEQIEQNEQIE